MQKIWRAPDYRASKSLTTEFTLLYLCSFYPPAFPWELWDLKGAGTRDTGCSLSWLRTLLLEAEVSPGPRPHFQPASPCSHQTAWPIQFKNKPCSFFFSGNVSFQLQQEAKLAYSKAEQSESWCKEGHSSNRKWKQVSPCPLLFGGAVLD